MINLSHWEHVFKGGPVGWDWPSANGLVIGAATDRTFGKFAASETWKYLRIYFTRLKNSIVSFR